MSWLRVPSFLRLPLGFVLGRDPGGQGFLLAGMFFETHLYADHIRDGKIIARYDLGSGVVTTAGVTQLASYFNNAGATASDFKFHDSGTGANAPAIGDTDLQTPAGPTTRATGSQGASTNTYTTIGTINYTDTLAITEWGLFRDATRGAPDTMWDRKTFSAINVVNLDSIQFTYVLTINAGG